MGEEAQASRNLWWCYSQNFHTNVDMPKRALLENFGCPLVPSCGRALAPAAFNHLSKGSKTFSFQGKFHVKIWDELERVKKDYNFIEWHLHPQLCFLLKLVVYGKHCFLRRRYSNSDVVSSNIYLGPQKSQAVLLSTFSNMSFGYQGNCSTPHSIILVN